MLQPLMLVEFSTRHVQTESLQTLLRVVASLDDTDRQSKQLLDDVAAEDCAVETIRDLTR